jgi:ribosomal protein L12E/L44/L45/RPP1/RPP2
MRVEYDNDVIYREIRSEILRTGGDYNTTTIIENVQALGFAVEISVMESRIKTYLSNASKDIKEMVKKAKKVSGN